MSHDPQPLGGKIISKPVMIFGPLIVICMLLIVKRLVFGLGSVSDLNGGFPWGVWIAFDLLIGTGFACGGWALAWAVYVFNRGQYHPLVRPALLASLFGYSLGGLSITIDVVHFVRPVFSGKALLKACTNGSSELMTNLSASLVGALYNWQLLRLGGADGVAAYGVIMYVSFIFAAIFIGYAQGCAPVVSYHYGADNTDELKNLLRISLRVIAVGGVAMLCFSELLAAPLSRFFVGYDVELLELTTLGMKLYSLSFLLCGFNIFGSAFFTALNNGIVSAVISFLRTLVFQVTAILVLPHLLGMNGIWLSVVAAEIAALFVNAFFLVKNRKKYQY